MKFRIRVVGHDYDPKLRRASALAHRIDQVIKEEFPELKHESVDVRPIHRDFSEEKGVYPLSIRCGVGQKSTHNVHNITRRIMEGGDG